MNVARRPVTAAGSVSALRATLARGHWLPVCDAAAGAGSVVVARGVTSAGLASLIVCAVGTPIFLATLSAYDVHAPTPGSRLRAACELVFAASVILFIGLAAPGGPPLVNVHRTVLATGLLVLAWLAPRSVIRTAGLRRAARALVIGSGVAAQRVVTLASRHRENGLEVIGLLDDDGPPQPVGGPPLLGGLADLEQVLHDHRIDRVIVAFTRGSDADLVGLVRRCDDRDVSVDVVPRLFDVIKPGGNLLGGLPLAEATSSRRDTTALALKRTFDIVGALVALIVSAPLMAMVAIAVWIMAPGPILFRQERIGRDGQPFQIAKFRTMSATHEAIPTEASPLCIDAVVEQLKAEAEGLTPLGAWLRRMSLDELPQLWCVLCGTMSLVGPRPLRAFEVATLDPWQFDRLSMRPGITGLWQVLGRSDTRWEERMRLDYLYTRHWSLAFDIRIILRTVPAVLCRRGAR